jgi:ABC-2 type transport system ATP-binding protein
LDWTLPVRGSLRACSEEGRTVFLSTHTLEVAEAICDRVAIIHKGEIATSGTVTELKDMHTAGGGDLEDVFLTLVGSPDEARVIDVLREDSERVDGE